MNENVPVSTNSVNAPTRNAKSPIRFTTNALRPASTFAKSSYQNPISRYEHNPTPSQPTNRSRRLSAITSTIIAARNRFRYAMNRAKPGVVAHVAVRVQMDRRADAR
jgi:hypothetical protein